MKKFVTLFLLIVIVHMTNGKVIEFPNASYRYFRRGRAISIRIYQRGRNVAEFSEHAVAYVEEK